jgi:hypothetical protein
MYDKNVRGVASSPLPRDLVTIAARVGAVHIKHLGVKHDWKQGYVNYTTPSPSL